MPFEPYVPSQQTKPTSGFEPYVPPEQRTAPAPAAPVQNTSSDDGGVLGIFSRLAQKAAPYIQKGLSMGAMGVAQQYMQTHPKETAEAAGSFVKSIAETGIQFPKAAAAGIAGLAGNEKLEKKILSPTEVPILGKVKSLSAYPVDGADTQTPGEDLAQAADIYLTGGAPGAGKVIRKVLGKASEIMPKAGEVLSNVPARKLAEAATAEGAAGVKRVRELGLGETPESLVSQGEEAYKAATDLMAKAKETYGAQRAALIAENEGKLISRSKDFVQGTKDVLKKEGVDTTGKALDFVGSTFEGDASAQGVIQQAHDLMTRPTTGRLSVAEDLINRRQALSSLMSKVPPEEGNLRRVLGEMKSGWDDTLDAVVGGKASEMRAGYAKAKQVTQPIVDAMTVKQGNQNVFSSDKAHGFMRQAMSDMKFDKRELLSKLDAATGGITRFAEDAKSIGLNKAISRLDPETSGRVLDVIKGIIGRNPVGRTLVPFFSPKLWGEIALNKGIRSATQGVAEANKFKNFLIANVFASALRAGESVLNPSEPIQEGK